MQTWGFTNTEPARQKWALDPTSFPVSDTYVCDEQAKDIDVDNKPSYTQKKNLSLQSQKQHSISMWTTRLLTKIKQES